MNTNGAIFYRGPSQLDGKPIVGILTGLNRPSANKKTGPMVQAFILREDTNPFGALYTGEDRSICGDCSKRVHTVEGKMTRECYVNVAKSVLNVWRAYTRGVYGEWVPGSLCGKELRMGAYGDPCAIPLSAWLPLISEAKCHTGYTHQFRDPRFQEFRNYVMASADLAMDVRVAEKLGWRAFYVVPTEGDPTGTVEGAMRCPASREAGSKTDCYNCHACNGKEGKNKRHIIINQHK